VDTRIAKKATGKRAAVGFSGNRYFHPFAWDAIHLFELDYDEQGRVIHAWELGEPKAPRLDFTWDGQRLLKVTGRDSAAPANVVYTRSLNYNGDKLASETITHAGGKSSKIEYKYDKQGRLVSAECDADHSLDGRTRKVHFVLEEN
jgi:YD repeat-containing protein